MGRYSKVENGTNKNRKKDIWNINAGNYAEKDIFIWPS